MTKRIRWGILGAAAIAQEQMIPAIGQSRRGTVHAVASLSGKGEKLAEEFGIPHVFHRYEELLACEEVDAVYIALPNSMHREWIEKSVAAGKHVLCEKPIVLHEKELEAVFEQANGKGVHVMEAFMYRFHPQISEARRLLDEGAIGEVLTVRSRFHFTIEDRERDIRLQPELGGGVAWDIGCYCVNVMLAFIGGKPDAICVQTGRGGPVDTHMSAQLRFPNGVLGMADCSFFGPMTQEVDVIGTGGVMKLPYAFRPDLNDGTGVIELHRGGEIEELEFSGDAYRHQVEAFQDAILENVDLAYTQSDMMAHSQVMQELVKQLKQEGVDSIGANSVGTE